MTATSDQKMRLKIDCQRLVAASDMVLDYMERLFQQMFSNPMMC